MLGNFLKSQTFGCFGVEEGRAVRGEIARNGRLDVKLENVFLTSLHWVVRAYIERCDSPFVGHGHGTSLSDGVSVVLRLFRW